MNNCILMAEIVQDPQLRYTADSQMAIAEMTVEFAGLREEDPPGTLKVVGWGNMAQEIQERYHQGDRVIIEGRLGMNLVDRPEGFKEKRAELTASRIHLLTADGGLTSTTPTTMKTVPAATPSQPASVPTSKPPVTRSAPPAAKPPAYSAPPAEPADYDEIPF
jgi:single-stranded DNA-binding protein